MQLQSQKKELHQANQFTDPTRKGKELGLCDEPDMRNRASQEERARKCQEVEELQRVWCAEAERARHLRSDEFSTQEESTSSVNQFIVQIQEMQD